MIDVVQYVKDHLGWQVNYSIRDHALKLLDDNGNLLDSYKLNGHNFSFEDITVLGEHMIMRYFTHIFFNSKIDKITKDKS